MLTGKDREAARPGDAADAVCKECTDERKDKPMLGMTILRNLKQGADDKDIWDGGEILDPNNGKIYKVAAEAGRRRREARCPRLHRRAAARPHADLDPRRLTARRISLKDLP